MLKCPFVKCKGTEVEHDHATSPGPGAGGWSALEQHQRSPALLSLILRVCFSLTPPTLCPGLLVSHVAQHGISNTRDPTAVPTTNWHIVSGLFSSNTHDRSGLSPSLLSALRGRWVGASLWSWSYVTLQRKGRRKGRWLMASHGSADSALLPYPHTNQLLLQAGGASRQADTCSTVPNRVLCWLDVTGLLNAETSIHFLKTLNFCSFFLYVLLFAKFSSINMENAKSRESAEWRWSKTGSVTEIPVLKGHAISTTAVKPMWKLPQIHSFVPFWDPQALCV